MPSVKIEYRTLKDGSQSVRLKIYNDGKLNREKLPIRIYKDDPYRKKKIRDIEALRAKREYEIFFKPETVIKLQDHLEVVPEFKRLVQGLNVSSINIYDAAVLHFDKYFNGKGIKVRFHHLDRIQLQNYLDYLYTKVSTNTANLYFSKINRLLKDCESSGMIKRVPGDYSKRSKTRSQGKDILLIDELRKLFSVPYAPADSKWDIKKAMTLSFYTGMGLSDARIFRKSIHIRSGYFYYKRIKTEAPIKIAIPDSVIKMLPEKLKLPTRNTTNLHINLWCWLACIDKDITYYSMRHSFAVAHRLAGTPIELLSRYLGHSEVSMTIQYLSKFVELQMDLQGVRIPEL